MFEVRGFILYSPLPPHPISAFFKKMLDSQLNPHALYKWEGWKT